MLERSVTIDKQGRIPLPSDIRHALGIGPDDKLTLRLIDRKLIIETETALGPITSRIAGMGLPVATWEQMEDEIEQGRLR